MLIDVLLMHIVCHRRWKHSHLLQELMPLLQECKGVVQRELPVCGAYRIRVRPWFYLTPSLTQTDMYERKAGWERGRRWYPSVPRSEDWTVHCSQHLHSWVISALLCSYFHFLTCLSIVDQKHVGGKPVIQYVLHPDWFSRAVIQETAMSSTSRTRESLQPLSTRKEPRSFPLLYSLSILVLALPLLYLCRLKFSQTQEFVAIVVLPVLDRPLYGYLYWSFTVNNYRYWNIYDCTKLVRGRWWWRISSRDFCPEILFWAATSSPRSSKLLTQAHNI